jgi:hypothetical protein
MEVAVTPVPPTKSNNGPKFGTEMPTNMTSANTPVRTSTLMMPNSGMDKIISANFILNYLSQMFWHFITLYIFITHLVSNTLF